MDLPDEKIMCHRASFDKSCFDMVTRCKCQLWVKVSGMHPQTEKIVDHYACADAWMPALTLEVANMVRQNTASTDKVANEVKTGRDENVAVGAMLVQRARHAVLDAMSEAVPALQSAIAPLALPKN